MMDYKSYLERILETSEAYTEEQFNAELTSLFPKVDFIDWKDYWPNDEDVIIYIFHYGVFEGMNSVTVTDYSIDKREVWLDDYGFESFEDLNKAIKRLSENGWKLNEENLNEIKEGLIPAAKDNILSRIKEIATLDQLESFYKSLES